jgi:hypothetical protein
MAIGDRNGLLQGIGESLGREVLYESVDPNSPAAHPSENLYYVWSNHLPGSLTEPKIIEAAANIGKQLDLTFKPEHREVSYWSATPTADSTAAN